MKPRIATMDNKRRAEQRCQTKEELLIQSHLKTPSRGLPAIERFMSAIQKQNDCWVWTRARTKFGYGVFFAGRNLPAHRWSYEHFHAPIQKGQVVRHKCDNPPCVNPDHLEVGTHFDNAWDMKDRGRAKNRDGRTPSIEELSESEWDDSPGLILAHNMKLLRRKRRLTGNALAEMIGIAPNSIRRIETGRSWPTSRTLNAIAKALKAPLSELFFEAKK